MTVASQLAHLVMKVQQDVADLVIKGDDTLENLFPPKDEQPEWATFDEDDATTSRRRRGAATANAAPRAGSRCTRCRPVERRRTAAARRPSRPRRVDGRRARDRRASSTTTSLTLAQLRARLQSLSVADLEALLAYEEADQGPGTVPDAAGQQDHPRVRQVTSGAGSRRGKSAENPLPVRAVAIRVARLDRQARHGLGRGPDHPAEHAARLVDGVHGAARPRRRHVAVRHLPTRPGR